MELQLGKKIRKAGVFPLFYTGSISKKGSTTGWEGQKKADVTS